MDILNDLKDMVAGGVGEKIEAAAAPIAEAMPEGIVDGVEDMIEKATGMDLDLNGNEAPAESAPAADAE